ncbi:MAG: PfkB family carbohydrate kinase, partial [Candidatus Borkfalkia sp.]
LCERLAREGVRTAFVEDEKRSTGFTDVMTLKNGERTFFHARGANAAFSADDLPEEALDCDLFHLGYLLLLDRLDAADAQYGTAAARLLHSMQRKGIRTAVDTVSAEGGKFRRIVGAALACTDYAVMNEIEAAAVTGVPLRNGDKLIAENLKEACRARPVRFARRHSRSELGAAWTKRGTFCVAPSLDLPARISRARWARGRVLRGHAGTLL